MAQRSCSTSRSTLYPPSITIDTPAHESEGQDTSPNFAGSFLDRESGLREDTFYLYVDNTDGRAGKWRQRNSCVGFAGRTW